MKLSIGTMKLKEMVARSVKGAGNNKLVPLTSLMAIELKDGKFTLITTDATNYLYIIADKIVGEDFYAVVDANVFSKLISKLTCETVNLEINSELNYLKVTGNGTYKIELPIDENGEYVKYPNPYSKFTDMQDIGEINRSTISVILETIKPALAVTLENPCYTGYYAGNNVVGTDTYKIANMDVHIFDEPKLISSELMDLLSVMSAEKIKVCAVDDDLVFKTDDCIVVGKAMADLDDFAIDPIMGLVNTEFFHVCSVPKSALLQLLDRLSLFVAPYDKNAVYLTFTRDGLQVSSKTASGTEIISYVTSEDFIDFTCAIDIQMLTQEVKSITNDIVELYYGVDNAIKMTDGNITIIVALLEDAE